MCATRVFESGSQALRRGGCCWAYRFTEFAALRSEPGIYISDRIPVPDGQPNIDKKWKGIGIRIEDDVLVKDETPEVLSISALKEISDLEF